MWPVKPDQALFRVFPKKEVITHKPKLCGFHLSLAGVNMSVRTFSERLLNETPSRGASVRPMPPGFCSPAVNHESKLINPVGPVLHSRVNGYHPHPSHRRHFSHTSHCARNSCFSLCVLQVHECVSVCFQRRNICEFRLLDLTGSQKFSFCFFFPLRLQIAFNNSCRPFLRPLVWKSFSHQRARARAVKIKAFGCFHGRLQSIKSVFI